MCFAIQLLFSLYLQFVASQHTSSETCPSIVLFSVLTLPVLQHIPFFIRAAAVRKGRKIAVPSKHGCGSSAGNISICNKGRCMPVHAPHAAQTSGRAFGCAAWAGLATLAGRDSGALPDLLA